MKMTPKPRTYTRASACISYTREDKSDARIFSTPRKQNERTRNVQPRTIVIKDSTMSYAERLNRFGAIGDVD